MTKDEKINKRILIQTKNGLFEIGHLTFIKNKRIVFDLLQKRCCYHITLHNELGKRKTSLHWKIEDVLLEEVLKSLPESFKEKEFPWNFKTFSGRFAIIHCLAPQIKNKNKKEIESIVFDLKKENFKDINIRIFISDKQNVRILKSEIKKFRISKTSVLEEFYPHVVIQCYSN